MEVSPSTASRRSSLIASADVESNLSSARRQSLEVSSSSTSSNRTPRDMAGSSPSPQLSFGSKRRRSKQITPLPLDLGSSSMETNGNGGAQNSKTSPSSRTNNPDSPNPSPPQKHVQDDEDEEEAGLGQAPRKLRRVASEEVDELESNFDLKRTNSKGKEKETSLNLKPSDSREASSSSDGKEGTSKGQVSHSRSLSDPQAEHGTASNGDGNGTSGSGRAVFSHSRIETPGQDQESNYTWQSASGPSPMSIASMSNFRPGTNPAPTSPQELQRSRPSSVSDADVSAPPYFPGSQRAVAAISGSPSPSNSQSLIHPSLAGLPGAGGAAGSKQQPSFVIKLYSMLEDNSIQDMIKWGGNGQLFSVASPSEFSKHVLPNYFKHSNWQSFVRQLNMYGFHKVNQNQQNATSAGEDGQIWEFKHPSFRRGKIHLLTDIKRKSSRPGKGQQIGSPTHNSVAEDNESRPDLDQSIGTVSPSPQFSSQAVVPGTMSSNFAFPPRRPESNHFNDPRGMPYQRPASHNGDHSRFPSTAASVEGFGLPVPQVSMGRPRAGTDAHSNPYNPPSPSTSLNHSIQGPRQHHHQETIDSSHHKSASSSNVRVDDLSDRIDAVIRHASYLETQLRNVSEQLFHSQQTENATRAHSLRMLNRLTNVCSSWCSTDTREGAENRRIMLEACHEEMAALHSLLEIEPGVLSPPITPAALPGLHLPRSNYSGTSLGVAGRDNRGEREREREREMIRMSPRMRHEGNYSSSTSPYSYASSSTSRYPPPPPTLTRTSSNSRVSPSFPFSQSQSQPR